ncbi:hypothetical protein AB6A40_005573 [Gnathostoma spinigerum]|uniref:Uncharacterized protein n=1 Tax=Gnathostoma spinigerum TaxID=75299 RepID=A0ABD6EL32_9BILA
MSITPQSWTFAESLYLLQLYNTENDDIWQFCSSSLQKKFGRKRPSGFFEKKLCEKRLSEILSEGHPEHVLPEKDGHFSRKELINSWISYMRKKAEEERQRNIELILVEMRKTAEIINRLNSDDCDMTADEMKKLIEEQKERDKNKNQELLQAELAYYRRKIREMEALRKANPGMYPRIPIVIPPSHPTSLDTDEPQSPIKPLFDDAGLSLREKAVPTTTMNLRSVSQSPIKSHMSQVHVKIPVSPVKSPRKKTARSPTTTENEFPNIVREMNVVSSNSLSKPNADSCLTETVGKSPAAFSKTTALLTSDDNETTAANDFGSSSCISTEISCGEEAASSSQAIAIRPPSSLLLVSDRHSVRPAGPVKMTKNEGKLSLSDEGDQV